MIGLPYPNLRSIELREKLAFLNCSQTATASCKPAAVSNAPIAPHDYYESLSLRAVNQSIGKQYLALQLCIHINVPIILIYSLICNAIF